MNESANKGNAAEAIIGIVFICILLGVFIYKFGTDKDTVINQVEEKIEDPKAELQSEFSSSETENDLYKKYVKEIYEAKSQGEDSIETQNKVEQIISNYKVDLETKTSIPPQTVSIKNVSNKFTNKNYNDNFEIIFKNFKERGGSTENAILSAQITSDGELLVLSQDDRETLLRIANEYETFAEKVQNLSTPIGREKLAKEIATSALNVSYILRKLSDEQDKNIYTLWISKYAENMSVIITDRYALYTL